MTAKKKAQKPEEPFTVTTWAGHPNYECRRCSFKTLDREEAVQHVIDRHAIKEAS